MYIAFFENEDANELTIVKSNNPKVMVMSEDIIFESDDEDTVLAFKQGFENGDRMATDNSFVVNYRDKSYRFIYFNGWKLHQLIDANGLHEFALGDCSGNIKYFVPTKNTASAASIYGAYIPNWKEGQIDYCLLPNDGVSILYSSSNIDDVVQFCFAYRRKYFYKNTWHKPLSIDVMESLDGWKFSFANGVWTCDRPPEEDIKTSIEIKSIFDQDAVKIEEIKRILSLSLLVSNHTKIAAIKDIINQGE